MKLVLYFSPHIASWFFFLLLFFTVFFLLFLFLFIYLFIYCIAKSFIFWVLDFCVKLQKIQIIDDFIFFMGLVLQFFFNFCPRNKLSI